jgi:Spy/CpxP family protein refolding chaperone
MIITILTLVGLGTTLFAGCHHRGGHRGADFMVDYMTEVLDLTAAQEEMADAFKNEILAEAKEMHAEKKQMHAEIKAQLGSESIDTERVKALLVEHRKGMETVMDLAVDRIAEFHATLSPEQRAKLIKKLEKWEARYHRDGTN